MHAQLSSSGRYLFDFLNASSECIEQVKCGSRGGTEGPDPPGKSQVIWVSVGDKQLDPLLEQVGPPPPGKCWTPLRNLEK